MSMYVGEALAGDGNEVAHIDLMIGSKDAESHSLMHCPRRAADIATCWPCWLPTSPSNRQP